MIFNRFLVDLIFQIKEKGYVTSKTQTIYSTKLGFYISMKWLRDFTLIENDGIDSNNYKRWILNKRGMRVYECLREIRELLKEKTKA